MVIRYDIFIKYKNVFDIPYLIPDSTFTSSRALLSNWD